MAVARPSRKSAIVCGEATNSSSRNRNDVQIIAVSGRNVASYFPARSVTPSIAPERTGQIPHNSCEEKQRYALEIRTTVVRKDRAGDQLLGFSLAFAASSIAFRRSRI